MAHRSILPVFVLVLLASDAYGQVYPTRPLRLIVPSAPGGQPDIVARLIAHELGKQMGQQVVVDNRSGASSIIGFETIAKAPADGHTFGFAGFPIMTNPSLFAKLPYDAARDFQPVVQSHISTNVLTVSPALPIRSVKELIEAARANPGKFSYGATGAGTGFQLAMELFKMMTATQITQVSYKGMQQAITDAMSGQVHVVCDNAGSILPHVRSGKLRALGVTTSKRSPVAPELPTIA